LRVLALKGIGLDEGNVGARFGVRILGHRVEADDVARYRFEIFERKRGGSVGLLCAFLLEQVDRLFGPAVHRIMQRHFGDAKFVVGFHRDGDFLDGARAVVVAGARDDHVRRLRLARLDEEIVGQAHRLALVEGRDVVHAVLFHANRGLVDVPFAA
jgi:hypothetical protein